MTKWEAGIYYDMPEDEYRSAPGVNKHLLDALYEGTPAHLKAKIENPTPPTEAMKFGTLMHKAILEPSKLTSLYHVYPVGYDGRTREGKNWKEAAKDRADIPFLTKEEHQSIVGMIHSVHSRPNVMRLIEDSKHEVSWFARLGDPHNMVECKGRVDGLSDQWRTIFDLKFATGNACSADRFQKDVLKYRYHVQASYYLDGISRLTDMTRNWSFVFIVIEKDSPPYSVRSFVLDTQWIELGRELYEKELELYRSCRESNSWPAYPDEFYTLLMPRWARKMMATAEDLDEGLNELVSQD